MIKNMFLLCLIVGMFMLPSPASAGKEYVAERYDVDLVLNADNSMQVTETIAFRFIGGPFTYVYRDLEKTRTDGISFISAALDDHLLPVNGETALEWVEVEDGDPLHVTWHFLPTSDQTRIYRLTYKVTGIVRQNDTDSIVWMLIPQEHDYRAQGSRITVNYPPAAKPVDQIQISGTSNFVLESKGDPLILSAGPVEADTPLIVSLYFQGGTLVDTAPAWQVNEQTRREFVAKTMPFEIAGFLAIFMVLMIAMIVIVRKPSSLDETTAPPSISKPVNPPTDDAPAVAAVLVARLNPSMMHSLATLIDLAQRGIVSIEQLPVKWYDRNRFELVRRSTGGDISPHEQVLLDALFTRRGEAIERIELREYTALLSRRWSDYSKAIKLEISTMGLVDPERKRLQTRLVVAGVCMILAGIAGGVVLGIMMIAGVPSILEPLDQLAAVLLGGSLAAFAGGLIYIGVAAFYSPLTAQGRLIAAQWKGFSRYLKDIIANREQAVRPDTFLLYLPFAAGFGLGPQWVKAFQKRGSTDVPSWFHALNMQDVNGSFGAFAAFMAHSNASVASSGSGGAGGASGGGGSGAG